MSKKKNILKNRKKNAEKERLDAKKHEALLDEELRHENDDLKVIEVDDEVEGIDIGKKKPVVIKDSKGKKIPTEAERKRRQAKVIDFKDAKRSQSNTGKHAGRMDEYSHTPVKKKHKVKYVLDNSAKKWLTKVIIIGVTIIAAIIIIVVALNSAEGARKASENEPINADKLTLSLVGMPPNGKKLVSDTGKYDNFLTIDGIDIGQLYDLDITDEEEQILEKRGQIIRNGIVGYNAEVSSTAKQIEENETADNAESKTAESSDNESRAEQFSKALNEDKNRQGE